MKRWMFLMLILLTLGSIFPLQGFSEGKAKIFLINHDFPPDYFVEHPQPPVRETKFWQALDKYMKESSNLELTENIEAADYRVELRCAGISWCVRLNVDVMTPQRDILVSYSIPGKPFLFVPNVDRTASRLSHTLEQRIDAVNQGGLGNYGMNRKRYN